MNILTLQRIGSAYRLVGAGLTTKFETPEHVVRHLRAYPELLPHLTGLEELPQPYREKIYPKGIETVSVHHSHLILQG